MDKVGGAAEAFDSLADGYDAWFESPEGKALFKAEVSTVRTLMKGLEPPFLEIGVGSGRFAEALGIGHGIDPSPALLAMAGKRGIRVTQGRGESLPYEDEAFGGVFMLFALCFVDDPLRVIAEARRVLKPGGGMIAGIINSRSAWGRLYSRKKAEGHPLYVHARFYAPDEVTEMIEKGGMRVESFSSTLLGPPSDTTCEEPALSWLQEGAGFVCILSRKGL